jgi:hypothetical protein
MVLLSMQRTRAGAERIPGEPLCEQSLSNLFTGVRGRVILRTSPLSGSRKFVKNSSPIHRYLPSSAYSGHCDSGDER